MTVQDEGSGNGPAGFPEVPEAVMEERGIGLSLVWLVPIVAALIGGFITWRAISDRGPVVTISFSSAEGLEAGKTKVRYKDLEIGTVTSLELADDLSRVIAMAELLPSASRLLTEGTRFWVVRPQVSAGRITGLGTLLSGAYIQMDAVLTGPSTTDFEGLDTAPVVTTDDAGSTYTLRSESLGSVEIGSPVFYRRVAVGKVTAFEMDPSGDFVTTKVFIAAPHDRQVRLNTRFWDSSGIDFSVDAEGIRVDTASIASILIGGISFDVVHGAALDGPVQPGMIFALYPNYRAAKDRLSGIKTRYLLHFDGSVQGLVPGAPVVFRGIRIGEVAEVALDVDWDKSEIRVPVVIEIEPERIQWSEKDSFDSGGRILRLVANGLRAELGRGNILTGQLQVAFDLYPDAEPASVIFGGPYPELPTVPTPLEGITSNVAQLIAKLEQLPLDRIATNFDLSLVELRETLEEINAIAANMNENVVPALAGTLTRLEGAVGGVDRMLADEGTVSVELRRALDEFGEAARSVRMLADYLERHPESIVQGKSR